MLYQDIIGRDSEIAPTDETLMVGGTSDSRQQTGRDSEVAPTEYQQSRPGGRSYKEIRLPKPSHKKKPPLHVLGWVALNQRKCLTATTPNRNLAPPSLVSRHPNKPQYTFLPLQAGFPVQDSLQSNLINADVETLESHHCLHHR